jgi:hypothetical protein
MNRLDDVEPNSSPTASIVSRWYARNSEVRRLWVYETSETERGDVPVHVVVALTPVGDSDDISPIWLAKCTGWQRDLERLIGRGVRLDWFDADTEVVPCADVGERSRVCLASVGWRD